MSRSYHNIHRDPDDDHNPKRQIPPKRTQKREIKIQRTKQIEWEKYIDERNIETGISFQVAGIIAKSLQVSYDESLKTRFMIEKIIEDGLIIFEKIFPKNQPLLLSYKTDKKLSNEEIRKEIQIAIMWIMKEAWEEEKKLRSIEICYNQDHI